MLDSPDWESLVSTLSHSFSDEEDFLFSQDYYLGSQKRKEENSLYMFVSVTHTRILSNMWWCSFMGPGLSPSLDPPGPTFSTHSWSLLRSPSHSGRKPMWPGVNFPSFDPTSIASFLFFPWFAQSCFLFWFWTPKSQPAEPTRSVCIENDTKRPACCTLFLLPFFSPRVLLDSTVLCCDSVVPLINRYF